MPFLDREAIRKAVFDLCYQAHGGSGLNITYSEVMDLDWIDLVAFHELLAEAREAEAKAVRDANRPKR